MTSSEATHLDRLEVAGRRYSQDTLLESDADMENSNNHDEKSYSPVLRGASPPRWFETMSHELRGLRASIDKHIHIPYLSTPPSTILKSILFFILPSFLSPHGNLQFKKYKPNSTEWLDGLRGIAAFFVFIYHFVVAYVADHDYAWDPVRHPNLIQLPILRLFYSGTAMVRIFFVISGFALTYKPTKLMRKPGSHGTLMKTIASSVFRRYLRLFLPCLGAFFMIHCWRAWGAFDWFEAHHMGDSRHAANPKILPGDIEKYPEKSKYGFYGQMGIMLNEFWLFAVGNPLLHQKYDFATDKHMWTIPTEYVQSMSLFLLIAMVAHVRRNVRVYLIIPWCYGFWAYYRKFDYPLFVSGYFLAEIHAAFETPPALPTSESSSSSSSSSSQESQAKFMNKTAKTIFWSFLAFLGLWLLSFPTRDGDKTFGYVTLCKLTTGYSYYEKRVAWQSYGASILCFALLYLPRAQQWLSIPLFQYLGRVSFSLYLMHGCIIRTMGHRLVLEGWKLFPADAYAGRMFINVIVFLFTVLPTTIWLSDIFWRAVEGPSTNFVRWLEGLVLAKEEKAPVQVKLS